MRANDLLPSFAIIATGLLWGVYWIPLRALEAAGLAGPWATLAPVTVSVLALAPVALVRWRRLVQGGWPLLFVGLCSGSAFVLYSNALLLTEVVTAILLFYLTPVWSTLLARVFLGQPIAGARIVTIILGLGGMAVILGVDSALPLPRGVGDWLGLVSGIFWAIASVGIRKRAEVGAVENTFAFLAGGMLVAAVAPMVLMPERVFTPIGAPIGDILPLLALVALVWFVAMILLLMWGAKRLDPGRVGILLMGEVLVGAASAAWLTDEPFGVRQVAGGGLIIAAAVIDILAPEPGAAHA